MTFLYIAIGGALGSVLRFLAQSLVGHYAGDGFPLGTMLVNISGSLLMGLFIGWMARVTPEHAENLRLFVAVGVLGGYTTFSSFSLDAIALMENGALLKMAVYVIGSVVCSLAALFAGLYVVRSFA